MRIEKISNVILTIISSDALGTEYDGIINFRVADGNIRYADFNKHDEKLVQTLKEALLSGSPVTIIVERSEIDNRDKVVRVIK